MGKDKYWVSDCVWTEWIKKKAVANAGVVLVNQNNEVLLLKRKQDEDEWVIPSGGINRDEFPRMAAARELFEETGIKLSDEEVEKLVEIMTATFIQNNKKTDITVTFLAYGFNKKARKQGEEHVDVKWLPIQEYQSVETPMLSETRKQLKNAYGYILYNM